MEIGKFLSKDLVGHSLSFLLVWTLISRALKQAPKEILKQEQKDTLIWRAFKHAHKVISLLKPCGICMEYKPIEKMFKSRNCSHSFCEDCVARFLAVKIQDKKGTIKCPDPNCNSNLDPQQCISILPKDVFERWGDALVDSVFGTKKIYCPFKDCSTMLVNDGNEVVRITECPHCHRLFCAQCQVPWHAEVDCLGFQILKKGGPEKNLDLMAMELAKKENWKRCPKCSFYVEKKSGCNHISCRYRQYSLMLRILLFFRSLNFK